MSEKDDRAQDDKKLLDHEYDGIRELDNPLPGWWLATFYLTIAFGIAYYAYYEIGSGPSSVQELGGEIDAAASKEQAKPPKAAPAESELLARCISCHGARGEGLIGPNLTDRYWIHGGKITDIFTVVTKGVLEKGMPSWEALLKPEEAVSVVSFVWSLRGTNVSGKAPQGNEVKD
jgi:cytochrome c oxidase cbb3-type subunit 3